MLYNLMRLEELSCFWAAGFFQAFQCHLEEIHQASEVNIYSRLWLWFENI